MNAMPKSSPPGTKRIANGAIFGCRVEDIVLGSARVEPVGVEFVIYADSHKYDVPGVSHARHFGETILPHIFGDRAAAESAAAAFNDPSHSYRSRRDVPGDISEKKSR